MRRCRLLFLYIGLWCAPALALAAAPAPWRIDAALSTIEFTATQAGARFVGRFRQWSGDIRFDAADLVHSQAVVNVSLASVDTRSADRDAALVTAAWFDPAHWPKAVFATRAIRANAHGFEADAQLTIRGQTRPVRLQFQVVKTSEGALRLTGTARLTRLAFGLGSGEFETTDWVGNDVEVRVVVVAHVR